MFDCNKLKDKKLLILGGITASIEAIEFAHKYGVKAYVTDYLEDSPAKKYADKSFMVSTTDVDAVAELCRNEGIDGIFTGNVDLLLPYYAKIGEKIGLPTYGSYEQFCLMTDKKMFKDVCRKYNVPVIPEYTEADIENGSIKFPVIVKPVDSSGSKGITICENYEELSKGIEKALSYSPSKNYIIEKYMTGDEAVLYYYFQDGNPVFIAMCDRYVLKQGEGLAQLPTSYIFPSRYTGDHIKNTDKLLKDMFRGIEMQNGPIFIQCFVEDGIPYIYEPGYRLCGAREQYIIAAVNGISSPEMLINFALTGKMADVDIETLSDPYLHGKYCCKLSPLIGKGKISSITGVEEVRKLSSVAKLVLNNNVNDVIDDKNMGTLKQVAYRAFIVEDSIEELRKTIDYIQDTVVFADENGKSMMLEKYDTAEMVEIYMK